MEAFVQDWGYLGVFLGIIATGLGFPMPEELPVVIGGALAGWDKALWWIMLPVCIVGVIIGDSCLYFIGRIWGAKLVERPFFKNRFLPPQRLATITDNFHKYGIKILLFARLTPGFRAPIFLTAGLTQMSLPRFLIADGIYAIPGVSLLFCLGYFFTERMINLIEEEAGKVKSIVILVAIIGIAGVLVYKFLRRPLVTGNPRDVPTIMEPVSFGVDQMTSKMLQSGKDPIADAPQPTPAPPAPDPTPVP